MDIKNFRLEEIEFKYQNLYECDIALETIEWFVTAYNIDLNPPYQRGHVWSESQQIKYMNWFLRKGPVGKLYFNNKKFRTRGKNDKEYITEMVDGKQRFTAMLRFVRNEIRVLHDFFPGGVIYNDIKDQISFTMVFRIAINTIQSNQEIRDWFVDLNSGGTYVSEEHIEKVKNMKDNN